MAARARSGDVGAHRAVSDQHTLAPRLWPAVLAAVSGSVMVGFMPWIARHLYADGLSAPSMLFWRYVLALAALIVAARAIGLDLRAAGRRGAWKVVLVGMTLGTAQTLCFWQSLKTLETGIAVLLFYTYPAVTLALDRLVFGQPIRPRAALCITVILLGAGLITVPGLQGGTIDPRGLLWAIPSPLVYALYLAVNARLLRHHPPLIGAAGLFLGMALSFTAAVPFIGLDMPTTPVGWILVVFIALGPGALTMTLFSYSVPRLGASSFAILANVELVTVVAIGILVLGEASTPSSAIGGGLIVAGILTHALARREAPLPRSASPSPPPGAERAGVRWGIPEQAPIRPPHPPIADAMGPSLSALKGGEGILLRQPAAPSALAFHRSQARVI
jgi:drug/metabolite transporter (DMT)-like permease